eukprot:GFUD01001231.1.p1 GENE.GFUD01001231.1~~GFUD01001231.1.p1  ORF type:complete len:109 (+),score=24.36 GFUD01001231.1:574-900(+)
MKESGEVYRVTKMKQIVDRLEKVKSKQDTFLVEVKGESSLLLDTIATTSLPSHQPHGYQVMLASSPVKQELTVMTESAATDHKKILFRLLAINTLWLKTSLSAFMTLT